jgi:hypothetical protein
MFFHQPPTADEQCLWNWKFCRRQSWSYVHCTRMAWKSTALNYCPASSQLLWFHVQLLGGIIGIQRSGPMKIAQESCWVGRSKFRNWMFSNDLLFKTQRFKSILARERFRVGCWLSRTYDFYMRSAAIWQSLLVKPFTAKRSPKVGSPGVSQELYSKFVTILNPMSVSPQAVDTTTSEALDSPYSRL